MLIYTNTFTHNYIIKWCFGRILPRLAELLLTNGVVALLHIILLSLENSDGARWLNFKITVGNFKRFLYVEDYR